MTIRLYAAGHSPWDKPHAIEVDGTLLPQMIRLKARLHASRKAAEKTAHRPGFYRALHTPDGSTLWVQTAAPAAGRKTAMKADTPTTIRDRFVTTIKARASKVRAYYNTRPDRAVGTAADKVRELFVRAMRRARTRSHRLWEMMKDWIQSRDMFSSSTVTDETGQVRTLKPGPGKRILQGITYGLAGIAYAAYLVAEAVTAVLTTAVLAPVYVALQLVRVVGVTLLTILTAVAQTVALILMAAAWLLAGLVLLFVVLAVGVFTVVTVVSFAIDRTARAVSPARLPNLTGRVTEHLLQEEDGDKLRAVPTEGKGRPTPKQAKPKKTMGPISPEPGYGIA